MTDSRSLQRHQIELLTLAIGDYIDALRQGLTQEVIQVEPLLEQLFDALDGYLRDLQEENERLWKLLTDTKNRAITPFEAYTLALKQRNKREVAR